MPLYEILIMSIPLQALIIEDSESDTLLLIRQLRQGGFEPVYKRMDTEEEMRASLAQERWDIIFSDHMMPQFNSREALRVYQESGLDIPFIIISGTIGEEAAIDALKSGASDYLVKGKLARLIPAVERELREAKGREARRKAEKELAESHRLLQQYTRDLEQYTLKLEQSNKELEHFAVIASHDLQAPLRKVKMFSDYLRVQLGDKLDAESMDSMMRMQRAVTKMQNLIDDLLDLSRVIRKGKPFQKLDLSSLVQEVISDLSHNIKELNAQIELGEMVTFDADPTQIQQLLHNLIENALKFRQEGKVPVIQISSRYSNEQFCEVVVSDNGIGFKEEYKDRIFQVFERLHGERYLGTGIGLSICKKIAERHNGRLDVHSAPGQGATFILTLPIHQESDDAYAGLTKANDTSFG